VGMRGGVGVRHGVTPMRDRWVVLPGATLAALVGAEPVAALGG
jgi:hypothetical protein